MTHGESTSRAARRSPAERGVIILSHGPGCFDGTTCAVAIARYYTRPTLVPKFSHPSELDGAIREISLTMSDPHDLWITDMTWKDPSTDDILRELRDLGWSIFWIDHHTNALEKPETDIRNIRLTGCVVTNKYSASRLVYEYLRSQPQHSPEGAARLSEFHKVVMLADEHDRWLHHGKDGEAMRLALAVEQLGRQGDGLAAYHALLEITADASLTPQLEAAYTQAKQDLEESLSLARRSREDHVIHDLDLTLVHARCHQYVSQVGDVLRSSMQRSIIVLFNDSDRRYSLRKSHDCDVDLAGVASLLGGGGHPCAAGFQLASDEYNPATALSLVEQAIRRRSTSP